VNTKSLIWCRISSSDDLPRQLPNLEKWWLGITDAVRRNPFVDWAFSYVLTETPNIDFIIQVIRFAHQYRFTHVRLVNDIFDADRVQYAMYRLKDELYDRGVDLSLVNFQDRAIWTQGQNPCYLSLVKPVVGADGYLYPCCGAQYALDEPTRDYESSMQMGSIRNFVDMVSQQTFFDGSICTKCFYAPYNQVFDVMVNGLHHEAFI
jgi:hypothetical protein